MKTIALFLGLFFVLAPQNLMAGELKTIASGICEQVQNHQAVNPSDSFSRDIGKLYCYTRIIGPYHKDRETHVIHAWYWGDTERARIQLPVKSSNWGTYSSKIIQRHETGPWRVDVIDAHGELIESFAFTITE